MKRREDNRLKTGWLWLLVIVVLLLSLGGCGADVSEGSSEAVPSQEQQEEQTEEEAEPGILTSTEDIALRDADGGGENYVFYYDGQEFRARYTPDNWKIYDSYMITNGEDMKIICQALSEVHPVHGKDYVNYRTPEDMAYEWQQHNFAFYMLPEESPWRQNVQNVDLDPKDQGKSFSELYEDRKNKAGSV